MFKTSNLFLLILLASVLPSMVFAQHQDVFALPDIWKGRKKIPSDTNSILNAFKNGTANGHFRYYFSITDNESNLSDAYANAGGGGLRFETARYKGFNLAISGFYVYNLGSSDLSKLDTITNQGNRYEIGLFSIEDPTNKRSMERVEEFYIGYSFKETFITFGKQLINTPFINLQDGRMRPTGVEGIYVRSNNLAKRLNVEGGYLYNISPRSTVKWYKAENSIGLYPVGRDINGGRSEYFGNTQSKGIALIGAHYKANSWLKINLWNFAVDNILNSFFVQTNLVKQLKGSNNSIIGGLQFIRQDALGNGGNENQNLSYTQKGAKAVTFGAKVGIKTTLFETSLNYNRITNHGRYLSPREWGRDPFFTFMPRERNEGFANVHAFTSATKYTFKNKPLSITFMAGYFNLPDVLDFAANKYGVPSYAQTNLDIRYSFKKTFEGLDLQLLLVRKYAVGETYDNLNFVYNKVNMNHANLVLNYHF